MPASASCTGRTVAASLLLSSKTSARETGTGATITSRPSSKASSTCPGSFALWGATACQSMDVMGKSWRYEHRTRPASASQTLTLPSKLQLASNGTAFTDAGADGAGEHQAVCVTCAECPKRCRMCTGSTMRRETEPRTGCCDLLLCVRQTRHTPSAQLPVTPDATSPKHTEPPPEPGKRLPPPSTGSLAPVV